MMDDEYNIEFAPQRAVGYYGDGSAQSLLVNPFIEKLRQVLVAGGWHMVRQIRAWGYVSIPGWSVRLDPMFIGTSHFWNDQCTACFFGLSGDCGPGIPSSWYSGTLGSLAAKITDCTHYVAYVVDDSPALLKLVAKGKGPDYNEPYMGTQVGVGLIGESFYSGVAGGGYEFVSKVANGRTQYRLKITEYHNTGVLQIKVLLSDEGDDVREDLELSSSGNHVEYLVKTATPTQGLNGRLEPQISLFGLANVPRYKIIANPYQLAIIDVANPLNDGGMAFNTGGNSFFCSAPWTDNPNISKCVVVVGYNLLMNKTVYSPHFCSYAINDVFNTFPTNTLSDPPHTFGLVSRMFSYSQALRSNSGRLIKQNAWLMAASNANQRSTIVGKFWDALAMSGLDSSRPFDEQERKMGLLSRRTNVGTISSLWLCESIELGQDGGDFQFTPPEIVPVRNLHFENELAGELQQNWYSEILLHGGGGQRPYTWTADPLPDGMFLKDFVDGVGVSQTAIAGYPSTVGEYSLEIYFTDALSSTSETRTIRIIVSTSTYEQMNALCSREPIHPWAQVGVVYDSGLFLDGPGRLRARGGTLPYDWEVSDGSIPPGLTLEVPDPAESDPVAEPFSARITGTPTTEGDYLFSLSINGVGDPASSCSRYAITVLPAATP